jgi:hypothetical protein
MSGKKVKYLEMEEVFIISFMIHLWIFSNKLLLICSFPDSRRPFYLLNPWCYNSGHLSTTLAYSCFILNQTQGL